ncbi:hypothetical protein PSTG_01608 [Puccinia striiformis f. sp. tritici PST-78]|uniref:Lon protease homolog n=1 Tax=Puccinia striiformis f. sp. tritici PST-78 TaxID=1165861 RepID=A0A0L0W299_9BASI|nr:hypothetical protein PSTG_01608 [Puccinia striiformis f. sp. tritici PST-78]
MAHILVLPANQILFPLQTITLESIELSKLRSTEQEPVYIGCLPLKSNSQAHQWGTLARLLMTNSNSNKISLLGLNRFKVTSYHSDQHPLKAQIINYEEIPLKSTQLIPNLKDVITRFINLLTQPSSAKNLDKLIDSLKPNQCSFLIDLMIRDIQLITWDDKLEFLSYYDSEIKLSKFIQLITKISDQIQVFYTQSNFIHPSSSNTLTNAISDSKLSLQQKELLIKSRLNNIKSQLTNGVQQLNQLYGTTRPSPLRTTIRAIPRSIIFNNGAPPVRRPIGIFGGGNPFSDMESEDDEHSELEKKIQSAGMSKEAFQICTKELKRLRTIQPSSVEHSVISNYLQIMLELPWSKTTTNQQVLAKGFLEKARTQLDLDHFGMLKVKQRLIEFLAVIKLRTDLDTHQQQPATALTVTTTNNESKISRLWKDNLDPSFITPHHQPSPPLQTLLPKKENESKRAPILLLVGPPGVGKTSIAKSIAKAMNKKFYRISLGGVKDESEIRGHRRTYVGSMPGTIVQALRRVGVNDPVILLDEIDKVGNRSINGDPASALLEVLDPEQNATFVDHYINTPIDLSSVLFLATANSLSTISPPLLDRLEVIHLDGYTLDEKIKIAERNLIPKQIHNYSLKPDQFLIDDSKILEYVVLGYTSEAGVRGLERQIGALCRAKVLEFVHDRDDLQERGGYKAQIDMEDVRKILGPEQYEPELSSSPLKPGVAIGMAYQGSGNGTIMYIETTIYPGKGALKLTGSLGEVIKESVEIAISWIKSNQELWSPSKKLVDFEALDLHVHFPNGSVKKDGPSAGIGILLAIISVLSDKILPYSLAVTGEISLRGQVLPVGGIKEKVLAASRSGIKRIILPSKNAKEINNELVLTKISKTVEIVYVDSLVDLVRIVFGLPSSPPDHRDLNLDHRARSTHEDRVSSPQLKL